MNTGRVREGVKYPGVAPRQDVHWHLALSRQDAFNKSRPLMLTSLEMGGSRRSTSDLSGYRFRFPAAGGGVTQEQFKQICSALQGRNLTTYLGSCHRIDERSRVRLPPVLVQTRSLPTKPRIAFIHVLRKCITQRLVLTGNRF